MDTDRMKIVNPKTGKPEYLIVGDNQVKDLNESRLKDVRRKKGKGKSNDTKTTA